MRAKLFFLVGIGRPAKKGPRYPGDFVVFFAFLLPIRSAVFLTSVWSLRSRATSLWSIVVSVVQSYFAKFRHLLGAQCPPSSGFPGPSCHALPHPCILLRPSSPFFPVPSGPRGPPPSPSVCDPLPSGPPSSPPGPGFFASWSTKSSPLVTSLRSLRLPVTSFWSFVTSSRVRFFLPPSGPCNHFFSALPCGPGVRASLSPGPSSLHPGLTSPSPFAGRNSPRVRHPGAGSFSPHFIDLVLRSSPARVLRTFPVLFQQSRSNYATLPSLVLRERTQFRDSEFAFFA